MKTETTLNRITLGWVLALAVAWLSPGALAADAAADPQQLVRETANNVLSEVLKNKQQLDKNTSGIYQLVQEKVLPHFDFMSMSQSAMGRYWRDATDDQRARLTREFQELLVRTYATALLNYSGQDVEYLPVRLRPEADDVLIPTRVAASGSPPIPINYRLYRNEGRWKVYDVVIDNVSLVTNYRSTFSNQVRRHGVEGLIDQLASRNKQLRG